MIKKYEKINKMLNVAIVVLAIVIIILGAITILDGFHSRVGMVTDLDKGCGSVTVTCANGNSFTFIDDDEFWNLGDLCSMIVYDSGTKYVFDDKIVSVRYGGFVEQFEQIEGTIWYE